MHDFDFVLVGSGPSATGFLLSENYKNKSSKFCILDVAFDYKNKINVEPSKEALYKLHDVNNKTYYGDSFATNQVPEDELMSNLKISNSYAFGGLSNIWGAACMKYSEKEYANMGLKISEKNLEIVDKLLNIRNFEIPDKSKMSSIYNRMKNNNDKNIYVEPSQLAVDFYKFQQEISGLYGSVNGAIYNSRKTFIENKGSATVLKNTFLDKIHYESNGNIILQLINTNTRVKFKLKTKKLILGCGPINTSKLLLKSFNSVDSIEIKDSQGIRVPIIDFTFKGFIDNKIQDHIELTNFYLKSQVKEYLIHGQLYFCGEYIKNQISKQYNLPKLFISNILNMLYVYQGYLPSQYSSVGKLTLNNNKFNFSIKDHYDAKIINKLLSINGTFFKKSKMMQLNVMKEIADIYSVYHFGAISIKSSRNSMTLNSSNGSISDFEDIHIIDASILKNLPSGPITSTIMANAIGISEKIL